MELGHEAWHAPFEGIGRSRGSASTSGLPIDQRPRRRTRAQNTSDGACGVRPLFTEQTSQSSRRCEEGRHRATLGERVSNRVSADAVGRRSSFLRGRVLFASHVPLRPRRKGDAGAPGGRARRPGFESAGRGFFRVRPASAPVADAANGRGLRTRFAEAVPVPEPVLQPRPSGPHQGCH